MTPKVSIVLPTYNGEQYIAQSIDSILEQTFQDWELIVVDDCSTDNTATIIKGYTDRDTRIRVIRNVENQKLPKSLNIGFADAKGEYLTWTSDDNMYLPQAIEVMYNYLERERSLYMVCAAMDIVDDNGTHIKESEKYDDAMFAMYNYIGACFLYRREVLQTVGQYDADMVYVEDYDYWLRIKMRYGKIGYVEQTLYRYRWHENSLSIKRKQAVDIQRAIMREKYIDYIIEELRYDKKLLYLIFREVLQSGYDGKQIINKLVYHVPELSPLLETKSNTARYIIFGAGDYGERAYNVYREKVEFFADNNCNKVGEKKCGLSIISFEELKRKSRNHCILVAVSKGSVYEMISQLFRNEIYNYSVFTAE